MEDRTVICWPTREAIYPGALLDEARAALADLARAIAEYEPVTMIASPASVADVAERRGGSVEIAEIPINDSWFRDTGPIYVTGDLAACVVLRHSGQTASLSPEAATESA